MLENLNRIFNIQVLITFPNLVVKCVNHKDCPDPDRDYCRYGICYGKFNLDKAVVYGI